MNSKVWEASGHIKEFSDPLVECKKCHERFREDEIGGACANCGSKELSSAKKFNLLFKTSIGSTEDASTVAYLRGELAQAMFVDFPAVLKTTRVKIPFGIAAEGKVFRNEVTPGNFTFRTREFNLMEFEYFVRETEWEEQFEYWLKEMHDWISELGIRPEHVRDHEIKKDELAHYSKRTVDIEYDYPFGRKELYGIAYRADFDLKNHAEKSGADMSYADPDTKEKFIPHVIEPTFGLDRSVLAVLLDAYDDSDSKRIVLKLKPKLAPYKVAVFPLLANKPELTKLAGEIYDELRKHFVAAWDDRGNIGKRYYSQDEIGTPYCVTIDFESLEQRDVTVRDRDTAKQERIKIENVPEFIRTHVS